MKKIITLGVVALTLSPCLEAFDETVSSSDISIIDNNVFSNSIIGTSVSYKSSYDYITNWCSGSLPSDSSNACNVRKQCYVSGEPRVACNELFYKEQFNDVMRLIKNNGIETSRAFRILEKSRSYHKNNDDSDWYIRIFCNETPNMREFSECKPFYNVYSGYNTSYGPVSGGGVAFSYGDNYGSTSLNSSIGCNYLTRVVYLDGRPLYTETTWGSCYSH